MLKEDGPGAVIAYLSELVKLTATAVKKLLHVLTVDRLEPVSYTHLDVYKRQPVIFIRFPFPPA